MRTPLRFAVAGLAVAASSALATAPSAPAAAAPAAAAKKQCGFDKGVISSSWYNCRSYAYKIRVQTYNTADPTGPNKTVNLCVKPGKTALEGATGGLGYVVAAYKFNGKTTKCKP